MFSRQTGRQFLFRNKRSGDGAHRAFFSTELCILLVSLFFTLFSNQRFWSAWVAGQTWTDVRTWVHVAEMAMLLTAIHCLLLGFIVTRHTAKIVLGAVLVLTSLAVHYMNRYTVFFDVSMMRNIFHTDYKEARELMSVGMLRDLLVFGVIPAIVLFRLPLKTRPLRRALLTRMAFMLGAAGVAIAAIAIDFQQLSAHMRNQNALRYLITPGNYLVSTLRMAVSSGIDARAPRIALGTDARHVAATARGGKPQLLVVVVGETARAANWGLNGYARQTTPELAAAGVINFPHVTACGSNTDVSLPCMFSVYGRKDYSERDIRARESLLHVLNHAGIKTLWRDNQSGCKGVCDGLELQRLDGSKDPALCNGGRCLDEILLKDIESELQKNPRDMVIVLHQLGNHGPAYFQRYPAAYRRFIPTCDTSELDKCTREQIVNSYDNALLYTDHFLAQALSRLKNQHTHEAAMIYVSDHGESLGENGIYLHGLPYAIAPREQTEVPMVMWLSQEFAASAGIDIDCVRRRASQPVSHDYLFHSVLGLMGVKTSVYAPALDLAGNCRSTDRPVMPALVQAPRDTSR